MQFSVCELCLWFISLASARYSILLIAVGVCALRTAWMTLARYQSNGLILQVMSIFYLKVLFHQYSTVCSLFRNIVHKLVAP